MRANRSSHNEQKRFYHLLQKFRDAQLENYVPDLDYSTSDYHHIRPRGLTKTYSTCQFDQGISSAHGRQVSRFTVISNAAETERSYDPFKASRPQHLDAMRNSHAKITIHCTRPSDDSKGMFAKSHAPSSRPLTRTSNRSATSVANVRSRHLSSTHTSNHSFASSSRSAHSRSQFRVSARYKRGVSFSSTRGRIASHQHETTGTSRLRHSRISSNASDIATNRSIEPTIEAILTAPSSYIKSKKSRIAARRPGDRTSLLWHDDVRQLSTSLAKDCDVAFNSSTNEHAESKRSIIGRRKSILGTRRGSIHGRPLPPPPRQSESMRIELLEAKRNAELRKKHGTDSPRYLERMVSHLDRLIQPVSPTQSALSSRRNASAPNESYRAPPTHALPSINEHRGEDANSMYASKGDSRNASAPEPRNHHKSTVDRQTIRLVDDSVLNRPVRAPAPLTIRKKPSLATTQEPETSYAQALRQRASGLDLRQQYRTAGQPNLSQVTETSDQIEEGDSVGTVLRHKASYWFKRNSRSSDQLHRHSASTSTSSTTPGDSILDTEIAPLVQAPRRKRSGIIERLFKKVAKPDISMGSM